MLLSESAKSQKRFDIIKGQNYALLTNLFYTEEVIGCNLDPAAIGS